MVLYRTIFEVHDKKKRKNGDLSIHWLILDAPRYESITLIVCVAMCMVCLVT